MHQAISEAVNTITKENSKGWFGIAVILLNKSGNAIPLFYNNQTDQESADIIEVIAGETVSGIDASLVMGGEIHGKVL